MSIQIAVNVDPSAPNAREINAAIALLTALRDGTAFGAAAPALPGIGITADHPSAGTEVAPAPGPDAAFGTGLTADQAFGGAPAAPNASTAATPQATGSVATGTPAATSAPAGVEVDKNGMPWNGQIHTETKSKNQDGTWRYRRNTPKETIAAVEAQMRAVMALPPAATGAAVPNVPPVPSPNQQAPALNASQPVAGAPAMSPIPTAPGSAVPAVPGVSLPSTPATGAAVPTATASGVPENAFIGFIGRITPLLGDGRLSQAEVEAACAAVGVVGGLPLLSTRPDLVPTVEAVVRATLAPKGIAF